jgi:hypothetical protein
MKPDNGSLTQPTHVAFIISEVLYTDNQIYAP